MLGHSVARYTLIVGWSCALVTSGCTRHAGIVGIVGISGSRAYGITLVGIHMHKIPSYGTIKANIYQISKLEAKNIVIIASKS